MAALKKYDIFPFDPYAKQGKTVFSVIMKHPQYLQQLVDDKFIVLSAEARETLGKFLVARVCRHTTSAHVDVGKVEI